MRLHALAAIAAVVSVSAAAQELPRALYRLDLTAPDAVITAPTHGTGSGIGRGVAGQQPAALPLALELRELDRREYLLGGPIEYVVQLTNRGSAPIVLPWSADQAMIEAIVPNPIQAFVALVIEGDGGRQLQVGAAILDGAHQVPGTTIVLGTGDAAEIRVRGITDSVADRAHELARRGVVPVRASFTLKIGNETNWAPVRSTNAIDASFRLRDRRP